MRKNYRILVHSTFVECAINVLRPPYLCRKSLKIVAAFTIMPATLNLYATIDF